MSVGNVLDGLKSTISEKNQDYGNSWEKVGVIKRLLADKEGPRTFTVVDDGLVPTKELDKFEEVIGDAESVEVVILSDTPEHTSTYEENVDGVLTRLLDKVCRTYTVVFLTDEPNNETAEESAKDLTGYGAMLTDLIRRQ